jgi:hypothetical protein
VLKRVTGKRFFFLDLAPTRRGPLRSPLGGERPGWLSVGFLVLVFEINHALIYQLRGCRRVLVCTLQDAHIDMYRQLVRSLGISVGLWSALGLRSCRVAISVGRVRSVEEEYGLTTSELHRGVPIGGSST